MDILFALCLIIAAFGFYFMIRNDKVHSFRVKLIEAAHTFACEDIASEDIYRIKKWRRWYEDLEEVSYDRMVMSFKKVESFHRHTRLYQEAKARQLI